MSALADAENNRKKAVVVDAGSPRSVLSRAESQTGRAATGSMSVAEKTVATPTTTNVAEKVAPKPEAKVNDKMVAVPIMHTPLTSSDQQTPSFKERLHDLRCTLRRPSSEGTDATLRRPSNEETSAKQPLNPQETPLRSEDTIVTKSITKRPPEAVIAAPFESSRTWAHSEPAAVTKLKAALVEQVELDVSARNGSTRTPVVLRRSMWMQLSLAVVVLFAFLELFAIGASSPAALLQARAPLGIGKPTHTSRNLKPLLGAVPIAAIPAAVRAARVVRHVPAAAGLAVAAGGARGSPVGLLATGAATVAAAIVKAKPVASVALPAAKHVTSRLMAPAIVRIARDMFSGAVGAALGGAGGLAFGSALFGL